MLAAARSRAAADPFGNPVLAAALAISRLLDEGALDESGLTAAIATLRDAAAADRAGRLAAYVGGTDPAASPRPARTLASSADPPGPGGQPVAAARGARRDRAPALCLRVHGAPDLRRVARDLCLARGRGERRGPPPPAASHRPAKPTLEEEFDAANAAIASGRDALDAFCGAVLDDGAPDLARRLDRAQPGPGRACLLGRARYGWAHRYRLVG